MAKETGVKKAENTKSLSRYFRGVRSEFKKVVWPTRKELINYSLIVISAVIAFTLLFAVYDKIIAFLLSNFIYR